jgi:hypothetical protein
MTSPRQLEQVARIKADQAFWRSLVARAPRDRMNDRGTIGAWSFRDVAAHLAAWRNTRIPMIEAVAKGRPIPATPWPAEMNGDYDAINAWFDARDRDRSIDDVLADYDATFDRLAEAIASMPEELAEDRNGLPWTEDMSAVDLDVTAHLHDEHLDDIERWLASLR